MRYAPVRYAPVRHAPVRYAPVRRYKPPEGSPEGVPGLQPSEARPSRRAKRGSTEAPPSEARPREGHREVAITKKLKKVPPESPFIKFSLLPGLFNKNIIYLFSKKKKTP